LGYIWAFPLGVYMALLCSVVTLLIALEHAGFAVVEIFLWTRPAGLKAFHQDLQQARNTAVMAKNQGIYNAFLAAGLLWSCLAPPSFALQLKLFFLSCVTVAGIVGALTAFKRIFWIQSAPAVLALALLVWS
jgi:putative membrane protein